MTTARRTFAALTAAVLVALGFTTAAQADTVDYVALGDSYSAGVGAGSYTNADCKRSSVAYPELYAQNSGAKLNFQACTGATTTDVTAKQLDALSASTALVSISVGGSDAGFTDVMQECVLGGDAACQAAVDKAVDYVHNTLPGQLDGLYSAIRVKAPQAKVVVLGYPHIYQLGTSCAFAPSDGSRGLINGAADELDAVIGKAAANAGFAFADVRPAFTGHEACASEAWLNNVVFPLDESFHPNVTGQASGYYPAFTGAL
ncbi:SGNH/GDSL hydrolase family protein [Amycolatopsis dongchuanensis]|uniref:SGNH family lipase n=1 Tax=Amycolatopsis dongchuanensis TaxID=1070866 RepID=A0ABP8VNT1_9PSEU